MTDTGYFELANANHGGESGRADGSDFVDHLGHRSCHRFPQIQRHRGGDHRGPFRGIIFWSHRLAHRAGGVGFCPGVRVNPLRIHHRDANRPWIFCFSQSAGACAECLRRVDRVGRGRIGCASDLSDEHRAGCGGGPVFRRDDKHSVVRRSATGACGAAWNHARNSGFACTGLRGGVSGGVIGSIPGLRETNIVISRIRVKDSDEVHVATDDVVVQVGDTLLAVGTPTQLENFRVIVGEESSLDLMETPGEILFRRIVVTRKTALGKSLSQLALHTAYGVVVTRVQRADLEMAANPDTKLQFGDTLNVVGDKQGLHQAAKLLGNSPKDLGHTNFLPVFAGIALGVIAGMIPVALPGLPVPVKLGLAGGPLVLAIILSRIGRIGNVLWYMPAGANLALREMGIVLFLACVGLKSGSKFLDTLLSQSGAVWLVAGFVITLLPILIVGIVARKWLKMNYITLTGLVAGSMTDPPALAFAHTLTKSDGPSISYASVYPLTMLLRILCAQVLVLLLAG